MLFALPFLLLLGIFVVINCQTESGGHGEIERQLVVSVVHPRGLRRAILGSAFAGLEGVNGSVSPIQDEGRCDGVAFMKIRPDIGVRPLGGHAQHLLRARTPDLRFCRDDAARAMAPMIGPETHVLSLQNGVYTEELLAELYGAGHVWGAQSMLPAQVVAPGHVRQIASIDRLEFGRLDNVQDATITGFRDRLEQAGVWALLAENTLECLWRKFVMVGSYAAVSTLVRARLGKVRSCPESWQLYRELMQEAFAVGQAKGAGMADDLVEQHWADGLKRDPEVETSMQFDRERGARLELDWFSGYIVREGERLGIPTPCHRVAWMALKPWAEGS